MATKQLKIGDKLPADQFFVSKSNVRAGQNFGKSDQDHLLVQSIRQGKIIQPFKARPEGNGYGVYVGGRRMQAKKYLGAKTFTVGTDVLIDTVGDEEAVLSSWTENINRKDINPITRAKGLQQVLAYSPLSLRAFARAQGFNVSTLSEWLRVLELTENMQAVVADNIIFYYDALQIAHLKLGKERQDKLAELAREDYEAFKAELKRLQAGKGKRGIPKDTYWIDRLTWDKRNLKHQRYYDILTKAAETKQQTVPELIQNYIITHINDIAKEVA